MKVLCDALPVWICLNIWFPQKMVGFPLKPTNRHLPEKHPCGFSLVEFCVGSRNVELTECLEATGTLIVQCLLFTPSYIFPVAFRLLDNVHDS